MEKWLWHGLCRSVRTAEVCLGRLYVALPELYKNGLPVGLCKGIRHVGIGVHILDHLAAVLFLGGEQDMLYLRDREEK